MHKSIDIEISPQYFIKIDTYRVFRIDLLIVLLWYRSASWAHTTRALLPFYLLWLRNLPTHNRPHTPTHLSHTRWHTQTRCHTHLPHFTYCIGYKRFVREVFSSSLQQLLNLSRVCDWLELSCVCRFCHWLRCSKLSSFLRHYLGKCWAFCSMTESSGEGSCQLIFFWL